MSDRRIRFLADFDYTPKPTVTVAYKAGSVHFVRQECAEQAIGQGKARAVEVGGPPSGLAATLARKNAR